MFRCLFYAIKQHKLVTFCEVFTHIKYIYMMLNYISYREEPLYKSINKKKQEEV